MAQLPESIIGYIFILGIAALYYGIGIHAQRQDTPMGFWAGTKVDPSEIIDVTAYNRENCIMWKCYSLWYWAAGLVMFIDTLAAFYIILAGGTIGIVLLILRYRRIEMKYRK